jgi:hypothetical protein
MRYGLPGFMDVKLRFLSMPRETRILSKWPQAMTQELFCLHFPGFELMMNTQNWYGTASSGSRAGRKLSSSAQPSAMTLSGFGSRNDLRPERILLKSPNVQDRAQPDVQVWVMPESTVYSTNMKASDPQIGKCEPRHASAILTVHSR